jgi:hypothetical protein
VPFYNAARDEHRGAIDRRACHDVGAVSTSRDSTPSSPLGELDGKDLADVVCLKNCIGRRGDELSEVRKPAVIAILLDQFSDETLGCTGERVGACH